MRPPLSFIPLLPVTLAFIVGVIIGDYDISPIYISVPIILAILFLKRYKSAITICLVALTIGWLDMFLQSPQPLEHSLSSKEISYEGTVQSINQSATSQHLIVKIEHIGSPTNYNRSFLCRLTMPTTYPNINAGDIVSFSTRLNQPKNNHDLPDEWDIETFLYRQEVIATAYLRPEQINIIGENNSLIWEIRRIRPHIISLLGKSSLSDNSTEFLIATIMGDDSYLSTKAKDEYSAAGLAHILALSGLHVGLIAFIIGIALYPLRIWGFNNTRLVITILLLWTYAIITGLSPSVTRAVIMTTIYLFALILQRRHSSLNALCLAALIILLISPMTIYSIGFQLSFVAVASILLFTPKLNPINPRHRIRYYIMSTISVSIAATIGTGIISAYYFHSFPLYFLIGNILLIILLPIAIGGGILIIISEACGYDPMWLCSIIDFVYNIIADITHFSASLPHAEVNNIYFPAWLLISYFVTVILFLATLTYKRTFWGIATLIMLIFSISAYYITKPTYPASEYFFPRNTYYTNIIARHNNTMYLFTTAHKNKHEEIIELTKEKYRDYIGKRDIDSIIMVTDIFNAPIIKRNNRYITIKDKSYIIIDNDYDIFNAKQQVNYAIVCRGFKGKIEDVYSLVNADTLLLSHDLHPKRHDRYAIICKNNSIPYRSLRYTTSPSR